MVLSADPSQLRLDRFVDSWKEVVVAGVVSVDKNGNVIAAANRENKTELNRSVSDREFFKRARDASKGDYFIDAPVMSRAGSTKGKYIIIVSAPVIDENNNFNGVLAAAILVSDLVDFHLNDIKVLDSSNLYLISSSGEVIYSDQQNLLGQNFEQIFADDFLGKKKVLDIISTELKSDSESKIKIAIPSDTDNTKLTPYLISASPVNLNGDNWKVVISVPKKI